MNAILSAGIPSRYLTTAAICSPATFRLWPERAWLGRRPVPLRFAYGRGGISVADRLQRRHSCQDAACNQRSLLHTRRSAHAVTCAHPVSDLMPGNKSRKIICGLIETTYDKPLAILDHWICGGYQMAGLTPYGVQAADAAEKGADTTCGLRIFTRRPRLLRVHAAVRQR
jgi:hypothetical protein